MKVKINLKNKRSIFLIKMNISVENTKYSQGGQATLASFMYLINQ